MEPAIGAAAAAAAIVADCLFLVEQLADRHDGAVCRGSCEPFDEVCPPPPPPPPSQAPCAARAHPNATNETEVVRCATMKEMPPPPPPEPPPPKPPPSSPPPHSPPPCGKKVGAGAVEEECAF
jgi:hypothetical protein